MQSRCCRAGPLRGHASPRLGRRPAQEKEDKEKRVQEKVYLLMEGSEDEDEEAEDRVGERLNRDAEQAFTRQDVIRNRQIGLSGGGSL